LLQTEVRLGQDADARPQLEWTNGWDERALADIRLAKRKARLLLGGLGKSARRRAQKQGKDGKPDTDWRGHQACSSDPK
jgi:hypothetical protein